MENKKILLLGGTGVVGNYLKDTLCNKYEVFAPTRQQLNLLDIDDVKYFFKNNYFDTVINCAANTDSKMTTFNDQAFKDNVAMFNHVWLQREHYNKLINFGSGGEFDRSQNIFNATEEMLLQRTPADHYGMSKNIISRTIFESDNCYTLRLFGVFGSNEPEHRLLKRVLSGEAIELEDKYFDYYYIEDILPVVCNYIDKKPKFKDVNLVYPTKILLSYFVREFCKIHDLDDSNITINPQRGLNYTGDSTRWQELRINDIGYLEGLKRYK
jgi:GDP-L-fucose synthase